MKIVTKRQLLRAIKNDEQRLQALWPHVAPCKPRCKYLWCKNRIHISMLKEAKRHSEIISDRLYA